MPTTSIAKTIKSCLKKLDKPNTLIKYQGGGYDGCFWEWNYAFIDEDGDYLSIFHSGCNGCPTKQEMIEFIENTDVYPSFHNINDKKAMQKFTDDCSIDHLLLRIARFFVDNEIKIDLTAKCSCCHKRFDVINHGEINGYGENACGIGGIRIANRDIVCSDCHGNYSCTYCGEYMGENHKFVETDDDRLCEYCAEAEAEREAKEAEKDNRAGE